MYVVTPYPNVLYAFDLTKEGYPLKWKYRPDVNPSAIGIACCDAVNRGAFYADGKIVYNLLDGHTVAVDAGDRQGDLEDQGRRCQPRARPRRWRRSWSRTGSSWAPRAESTASAAGSRRSTSPPARSPGPRYNVGPGQRHAGQARHLQAVLREGHRSAVKSWPKDGWKNGGAPVWGWLSYDPELDLVYYGTGNPAP